MVIRHMEIKYHGSSVKTLSFQLSMYSTHRAVHANAVKVTFLSFSFFYLLGSIKEVTIFLLHSMQMGYGSDAVELVQQLSINTIFYIWLDQSAVTGEHTCMLLKPLNKDEFEVSESNELGFFGPFYTGKNQTFMYLPSILPSLVLMFWPLLLSCSHFRIRFSKLLR